MIEMQRKPTTPGEMLKEGFLIPLKWTEKDLARRMGCDESIIYQLINDEIRISSQLAAKLGSAFNISKEFWLNSQKAKDSYERSQSQRKIA